MTKKLKMAKSKETPKIKLPKHIAIIMDGNGRWAKAMHMPRAAGHRAGLETVKKIVNACKNKGIEILTLFAFSSENWQRPTHEVGHLLELFLTALNSEVKKLHKNNVQLRVIGDLSRFSEKLRASIHASEDLTGKNTGLKLVIAANYGGRWDIVNSAKLLAHQVEQGVLSAQEITPEKFALHLALHDLPEPDLFIRTSGEQRISNFLLWQLAYTELFFTDVLWPDFNEEVFEKALADYANRKRRFGGVDTEELKEELKSA